MASLIDFSDKAYHEPAEFIEQSDYLKPVNCICCEVND